VFDISQQMWCSWLGDGVVHGPVSQSHSGYLEQSPNSAICFASYPTYAITFFFFYIKWKTSSLSNTRLPGKYGARPSRRMPKDDWREGGSLLGSR
jgi:hypothetical protein